MPTSSQSLNSALVRGLIAGSFENQRLVQRAMVRCRPFDTVIGSTLRIHGPFGISPVQAHIGVTQSVLAANKRLFNAQKRLLAPDARIDNLNERVFDASKWSGVLDRSVINSALIRLPSVRTGMWGTDVAAAVRRTLPSDFYSFITANYDGLIRTAVEKSEELRRQAARIGHQFKRRFVALTRDALRHGRAWVAADWQRRGYLVDVSFDDRSALEDEQPYVNRAGDSEGENQSRYHRDPDEHPASTRNRARLLTLRVSQRSRCGRRHRWPDSISRLQGGHTSRRDSKSFRTRWRCSTPSFSSRLFSGSSLASSVSSIEACVTTTGFVWSY